MTHKRTTHTDGWHPIWSQLPQTLIALTSLVTAFGVIYIAQINKSAAVVNREAAVQAKKDGTKAVAAAENAAIASDKTHNEMKQVHRLVNSHLTEIMFDKKTALRRLATKTQDPEDIAAAEKAERQFEQRMIQEKSQQDSDAKAKLESDAKREVPIPK